MIKKVKKCRICGKEYEGCKSAINNTDGVFRWQEVACCPEHGAEYLRRVLASRGVQQESGPETKPARSRKKNKDKDK